MGAFFIVYAIIFQPSLLQLLLSKGVLLGCLSVVLVAVELSSNTIWLKATSSVLCNRLKSKSHPLCQRVKENVQFCWLGSLLTYLVRVSNIIWSWALNPKMFKPSWCVWKATQHRVCVCVCMCLWVPLHRVSAITNITQKGTIKKRFHLIHCGKLHMPLFLFKTSHF